MTLEHDRDMLIRDLSPQVLEWKSSSLEFEGTRYPVSEGRSGPPREEDSRLAKVGGETSRSQEPR